MLHHTQLFVQAERAWQTAFEIRILLPLVQIAAENRVRPGNMMIQPGLEIVRLLIGPSLLFAIILVGENRRAAEVRVGPESVSATGPES